METLNHVDSPKVQSSSLPNSHNGDSHHHKDPSTIKSKMHGSSDQINHKPSSDHKSHHISSKSKDGSPRPSSDHHKHKIKSSSDSPKPSTPSSKYIKNKDGVLVKVKSSSSTPSKNHGEVIKNKDSTIVKVKDPNAVKHSSSSHGASKAKDPSLKPKDPNAKPRDPNLKPKDPNLKPKDPNLKPKEHSSNSPSVKHKDGSHRPSDPNMKSKEASLKPKDPSLKPRDPSLKPKDPSLKPKDPNKMKTSSSSSHSSSSKPDGSKHRISSSGEHKKIPTGNSEHKKVSSSSEHKKVSSSSGEHKKVSSSSGEHKKVSSSSGEHKKVSSSSGEHKKVSSSSGEHKKVSSSSGEHKVSSGGEHKKVSSGDAKKHSTSDSEHRKGSLTGEVKKVSSSSNKEHKSSSGLKEGIKKEKRPDGERVIKKEAGVKVDGIKKEQKHGSDHKVKVKTENSAKVKREPDQKVKSPSPVKSVKREALSDDEDEPMNKMDHVDSKQGVKRSIEDGKRSNEKVKIQKTDFGSDEEKPKKRKIEVEEDDYEPRAKKSKGEEKKKKKKDKKDKEKPGGKGTKAKKKQEGEEVWKWWEEEPLPEGIKWRFLQHRGPVFAPPYERLPKRVKFYYNGEHMVLSNAAEEVAGFYARMLDHDYTTKEVFNKNFFRDWRKVMSQEEKAVISDLRKCNFKEMLTYFLAESEARKSRTKEQKQELKRKNEEITEEYGFCTIDGHREKIGNFRIEPPGLFRGRGDHPKQGMLKKRILPEQVTINCSRDAPVPVPPDGHKWGKIIHDNKVTWLASWTENIQGSNKYVMLNPSSRLKGEKDWAKYETARKLKQSVHRIQEGYRQDWKSKEMRIRQRAVALYFIDKLALRAGNEKEEGETADTVGCCSLRVEHIKLHEEKDGKEFVVEFDFLGKDSIRYQNSVPVEKRVFKNLQLFVENKAGEDDLFDRLNTSILNKYLQELMEGLTAKVFRTYNASSTLQEQLKELTEDDESIPSKLLSYNRANRAVAILCNHQRAAPKTFDKQMENLNDKIKQKIKAVKEARKDFKAIKQEFKNKHNEKMKPLLEKKKKAVERLEEQLSKLEMKATDKEENKEIALGTSKLNYLDPRISVAWCKKWEVPIEKIYNRTQRDKFRWAIDMAEANFEF